MEVNGTVSFVPCAVHNGIHFNVDQLLKHMDTILKKTQAVCHNLHVSNRRWDIKSIIINYSLI